METFVVPFKFFKQQMSIFHALAMEGITGHKIAFWNSVKRYDKIIRLAISLYLGPHRLGQGLNINRMIVP